MLELSRKRSRYPAYETRNDGHHTSQAYPRAKDKQMSSRLRSISDVFFSPNDGLDLSNLRASLDVKRRVCKENKRARTLLERIRHAKIEEDIVQIQVEEKMRIKARKRMRVEEVEMRMLLSDERKRLEVEENMRTLVEPRA